ncbi:MAG: M20/M25/M40 family metallo-hydrolase [Thermodesulfobacteriota bacterium]|nr:M20/M25/M40 family metallo-hydrolase [Thermodesulfobacteriota bacterium]
MNDKGTPFTGKIIERLCSLSHRGATTENEATAANYLEEFITKIGGKATRQYFKTSVSYIFEVWWLLFFLLIGLSLIPFFKLLSLAFITISIVMLFLYFDWRDTWITEFPPQRQSQNVIGKKQFDSNEPQPRNRIVLMAHYDSAPVSLLYLPSMVKGFSSSLKFNLFNLLIVELIAVLNCFAIAAALVFWLRYIYMTYFFIQAIIAGLDYFRKGYTNGAADNASGVAVAITTTQKLWTQNIPNWNIELVLTGAEEVGMRGAKYYLNTCLSKWKGEKVHVLNFDNLGVGNLKIITKTGSITAIKYDGDLVKTAIGTSKSKPEYSNIEIGEWHTGDFDTIHFQRSGLSSLTLSAQDENGLIPNLHRPSDTVENVDFDTVERAANFAYEVLVDLINGKYISRQDVDA